MSEVLQNIGGEYYTPEEIEEARRQQEQMYYGDVPRPQEEGNLFSLFKRVLTLKENSKVGNLNKMELGDLQISVRDCQKIAMLGDQLGHPTFASFFRGQGEVILRTSSSKNGWFVSLFVTSKKLSTAKAEETLSSQQTVMPATGGKRKWTWFKRNQQQ
jgi:hypothetical protein